MIINNPKNPHLSLYDHGKIRHRLDRAKSSLNCWWFLFGSSTKLTDEQSHWGLIAMKLCFSIDIVSAGGHPPKSTPGQGFTTFMHTRPKPHCLFWTKGNSVFKKTDQLTTCCSSLWILQTIVIACIYFQWLYRLAVEEVPEDDYMLPLSEAEVLSHSFSFLSGKSTPASITIGNMFSGDPWRQWHNISGLGSSTLCYGTGLCWCWKGDTLSG